MDQFKMKSLLIFLVVIFGESFGGHLPSDWISCKGFNGTELNICLKDAIEDALPKLKNGVPNLKVPTLEPLVITSATIEEGTQVVHIVQNYKNFLVYGISAAKIPKLEATLTSDGLITMDIEAFMPEIKVVSNYDVNGRLYVFPVFGNGTCQLDLKNLSIKIKIVSEKFKRNDVEYLRVTANELELFPEHVSYNFDYLFDGNKKLGDEINKLLNDNWKEVFDDVKAGYCKLFEAVIADYANKVFYRIPHKEIF